VASLVAGGASDADADTLGVAVVALGNPGKATYQYQLSGGAWQNMPAVSESAALLLPASAKVRVVPKLNANGTVNLYLRAWDGSAGVAGGALDLHTRYGGIGTVSAAYSIAKASIAPVNDAPVLNPGNSTTVGYKRGGTAVLIFPSTATLTDVDSNTFAAGRLVLSGLLAGDVISLSGRFSYSGTSVLYTPDGQPPITIGTRNAGGGVGTSLTITFNSQATLDLAQRLLRNLRFSTTGAAGTRSLSVVAYDDQNAASATITRTINVT
jgi:hypothetical protein